MRASIFTLAGGLFALTILAFTLAAFGHRGPAQLVSYGGTALWLMLHCAAIALGRTK